MTAASNPRALSGTSKTGERITVIQGRQAISADPETVLTTVLGSCIAACYWDPTAKVGGMNHFLLPEPTASHSGDGRRYGVHAMELLLNAMFHAGARRTHLLARLFGGAQFSEGWDVGQRNASFATEFLQREGIPCLGGSLGGSHARRVEFWPASGRVRQRAITGGENLFNVERKRLVHLPPEQGVVQLF
jgi:chemotaxis protein CheD